MIQIPENESLNRKLAAHMLGFRADYFDFFERMYARLKAEGEGKKKALWFGDADFWFTLIHDQTEEDGSYCRAFEVSNSCTCSDENRWIVIVSGDRFRRDLHVRIIHRHGNYPRKQYPDKLNVRFFRDRNFVMDFVDKYHMTKLGGVYGDIRDIGYVISYEQRLGGMSELDEFSAKKDQFHLHHFYRTWCHFTGMLHSVDAEGRL